jgi:hypothetical protein
VGTRSYGAHVFLFPQSFIAAGGGWHPLTFGCNTQETYRTIASEMLRSNDVGAERTGDPDTFRRRLTESRKHIGETAD